MLLSPGKDLVHSQMNLLDNMVWHSVVYIISIVQYLGLNPLDAMGISLNMQKLMYKVLAPSIMTPYKFIMDLWRLWTHLCIRGWLSV